MTDTATTLQAELLATLEAHSTLLREGLQAELSRAVTLEEGRKLQFEIDPWSWGISSCASEELVLEPHWLEDSLPSVWFTRVGEADLSPDELISEAVCAWFARGWQKEGGPARFSPAYLFLHGYHSDQYDLERSCWVPAAVAFGD